MTDSERLVKLEEALRLIREVEFSYKEGTNTRRMIYSVVVHAFSVSRIGTLMTMLRERHMNRTTGRKVEWIDSSMEDDPYSWGF